MSLSTFSTFYYGFEVTADTRYLCFNEGGSEIIADVELGSYTPTELAVIIKTALDTAGALTYTVAFNRSTRSFTISSTSTFALLVSSGSATASVFSVIGFTGADRTGASSYAGGTSGSEYKPQFILQDHIAIEDWQELVKPSVQTTANGKVEVVRFGIEKFMQCNIKFATNLNIAADGINLKNNPTGVEDLRAFMQYLITKKPVEFMKDLADRNTFQTFILEKTDNDSKGTGYKLVELYSKNLPNFFETGKLVFRLIE